MNIGLVVVVVVVVVVAVAVAVVVVALALGVGVAGWAGRKVAMTAMPQMVAIYNRMGGGAAARLRRWNSSAPRWAAGPHWS